MDRLLRWVWAKVIRVGNVRVTTAAGSTFTFGDGTGKPLAIHFKTRAAERAVVLNPELRFGEAYMDGDLVVERGSIADVLAVMLSQPHEVRSPWWARLRRLARFCCRRLSQLNV